MKNNLFHSLLLGTFSSALASLPCAQVLAQDSPAPAAAASTAPAAKLTHQETEFVKKAGSGNAAEVKVAQLAQTNAESADVKEFANKMVQDHGDANSTLGMIATNHGMAFPPAETEKQKMMYEKLSKLHGAAFDKAYVTGMVAGHEKDLAEYKMAQGEVKDAALKLYVDKTTDVVAGHLTMIKDIQSKMMGAASPKG